MQTRRGEHDEAATPCRNSKVARLVSLIDRPTSRALVVLLWLLLVVAGLLVTPIFLATLSTSVLPVQGTASATAADALLHYFPQPGLANAVLCQPMGGAPLLDFQDEPTCEFKPHLSRGAGGIELGFSCRNESALGGGCITTQHVLAQLETLCEKVVRAAGPLFGLNKTQVEKLSNVVTVDLIPRIAQRLPNISSCPVHSGSGLTRAWLDLPSGISRALSSAAPDCAHSVLSFESAPELKFNRSIELPKLIFGPNFTLEFDVTIPAGTMWDLFRSQLLSPDSSGGLIAAMTSSCHGEPVIPGSPQDRTISESVASVITRAPTALGAQLTSQGGMLDAIQGGIEQTMRLSSLTLPLALLILAFMAGNLRLVLCTLINLLGCIAASMLIMLPVAQHVTVSTTAPSMMIAVALGMSIDYSLFMLTRFQQEVKAGQPFSKAVEIMMRTSGKIVLVSGLTLLLCFLMMLVLPVSLIATMGVSAAVTCFMAIAAALSLTPVLLLTFPNFFSNDRHWGLSCDHCWCRRTPGTREASGAGRPVDSLALELRPDVGEDVDHTLAGTQLTGKSRWPRFGRSVQKLALPVLIALLAIVVPFGAFSIPRMSYSVGLMPFMPTDAAATRAVVKLQDAFGVGALFPTSLIVVPPAGRAELEENRTQWLAEACQALQAVASAVDTDPSVPPFTASAFTGPMMLNGRCFSMGSLGEWSNVDGPYSATQVQVNYQIDPFSTQGQMWISRLREALRAHSHVATWHVAGEGPNQMDSANATFASFPAMIALMMAVVLLLISISSRSIVAPLRAVCCLIWMMVMTFGLAVYVFQDGCLAFLQWSQLGPRSTGAMSWMAPCIACPVVVGLGLDYDIFYTERVLEECEHGHAPAAASVRALAATANIISAAGLIMAIAFLSLLLCTTPTLNEISFLLIVGVLIDCFVTTKIIVPLAMSLLGKASFWPHKFEPAHGQDPSCRQLATAIA